MTDLIDQMATRLGKRIRNGRLRMRCPVHNGRGDTSLSLTAGREGRILATCFAGCDYTAIAEALALSVGLDIRPEREGLQGRRSRRPPRREVWTPPVAPTFKPLPIAPVGTALPRQAWLDALPARLEFTASSPGRLYVYTLADARPYVMLARWETPDGKEARPISWSPKRRYWRIGGTSEEDGSHYVFPIYNRVEIGARSDAPVLLVEGEKAADAGSANPRLSAFVVSCAFGGSSPRAGTQWSALRGRAVYAAPDADTPGNKWVHAVRTALDGVASSLKVLPPQELHKMLGGNGLTPSGWDIADGELSLCETCEQAFYPIEPLNRVCGGCTPSFA